MHRVFFLAAGPPSVAKEKTKSWEDATGKPQKTFCKKKGAKGPSKGNHLPNKPENLYLRSLRGYVCLSGWQDCHGKGEINGKTNGRLHKRNVIFGEQILKKCASRRRSSSFPKGLKKARGERPKKKQKLKKRSLFPYSHGSGMKERKGKV